jgi:hypothetical protein
MDFHLDHKPGDVDTIRVTAYCDRSILEQFLRTHGVDTARYPVPTTLTIDDGQITYEQYVLDADGKPIIESDDIKRETTTVDQIEPWPLNVAEPDAG